MHAVEDEQRESDERVEFRVGLYFRLNLYSQSTSFQLHKFPTCIAAAAEWWLTSNDYPGHYSTLILKLFYMVHTSSLKIRQDSPLICAKFMHDSREIRTNSWIIYE